MATRNSRGGWDITDEEAAEVLRLSGFPEEGSGGGGGCCSGEGCGCGEPGITAGSSYSYEVGAGASVSVIRGRLFKGYRPQPPPEYAEKGISNSGSEPDYEGIIFSDGTVAIRWLTQYRSTSIWASWEDFYRVHGHPEYGTAIVFE